MRESREYISLSEAAKYCNYSQEYLSLRARQGKLKAVKFGRTWFTKKEWLEEYIRQVEEYKAKRRSQTLKKEALLKPPLEQPSLPKKPQKQLFLPKPVSVLLSLFILASLLSFALAFPSPFLSSFKSTISPFSSSFSSFSLSDLSSLLSPSKPIQKGEIKDYFSFISQFLKTKTNTLLSLIWPEKFLKEDASLLSLKPQSQKQTKPLSFESQNQIIILQKQIESLFQDKEINEKKIESLKEQINLLKEKGIKTTQIVKEIQRIEKVYPKEIIEKQIKVLASEDLKEIQEEIKEIKKWKEDIDNLREITKKLKAQPTYTLASTAPIYVGSSGIQTSGLGSFDSLSVSNSLSVGESLGVEGSTVLGSPSRDTDLTVYSTGTFKEHTTFEKGATFGTSTLTIDENGNLQTTGTITTQNNLSVEGNLTLEGDLTVSGAQTYSGAASFDVESNSPGLSVNQKGTGNIALFKLNDTTKLLIDNSGNTTIYGNLNLDSQTASRLLALDSNKNIVSTDLSSWVSGTTDQLTVTDNGDGTITLSLPQDIAQTSSPTFSGLTLSSLTEGSILFVGSSGTITEDNSNLYWDDTNDRLGIGTSSPSDKLTVVGEIGIRPSSGNANLRLWPNEGDNWTIAANASGNYLAIYDVDDAVNRLVIADNGNVGIGTTSPNQLLTLYSSSNDVEVLRIGVAGGSGSVQAKARLGFGYWAGTTEPSVDIGFEEAGTASRGGHIVFRTRSGSEEDDTVPPTERMRITNTGNVGIGTTSPGAKLEILADGTQLKLSYDASHYTQFSVDSAGRLHITSPTHTVGGDVYALEAVSRVDTGWDSGANYGLHGIGYAQGDATSPYFVAGSVGRGYAYNYSGSGIDIVGLRGENYIWGSGSTGTIRKAISLWAGGITYGGDATATVNEAYGLLIEPLSVGNQKYGIYQSGENDVNYFGGNVGIGTTSPDKPLHVVGSTGYTAIFESPDPGLFLEGGTEDWLIQHLAASTGNLRIRDNDADIDVMTFKNDTGNVGIGTTSPSEKLEVAGNILLPKTGTADDTTQYPSYLLKLTASSWDSANSQAVDKTFSLKAIGLTDDSRLGVFNNSGTEVVTIKENGNVGIGTTSPADKLHIEGGGIRLSTGDLVFKADDTGDIVFLNADGTEKARIYSGSSAGINDLKFRTGGATRLYIDSSGNVGIGTTSPRGKLDVKTTETDRIYFGASSSTNDDSPKLCLFGAHSDSAPITGPCLQKINVDSYGRGRLAIFQHGGADYTSETEVVSILPNGNIGIGTTSPGAKLDVRGSILIYDSGSSQANWIGTDGATGNFLIGSDGTPGNNIRLVIDDNNGNVGIGTTEPGSKLEVVGAIYINNDGYGLKLKPSNSWDSIYWDNTHRIGYDSNYLRYEAPAHYFAGNVGIGTTSPGQKLDVSGNIRVTGDWYWLPSKNFQLYASANNQEWSFDLRNTDTYTGTYWQVWSDTKGSILAVRGDTGNVGIGTTSPSEKLEIAGQVKALKGQKLGWRQFEKWYWWDGSEVHVYWNRLYQITGNEGYVTFQVYARHDINYPGFALYDVSVHKFNGGSSYSISVIPSAVNRHIQNKPRIYVALDSNGYIWVKAHVIWNSEAAFRTIAIEGATELSTISYQEADPSTFIVTDGESKRADSNLSVTQSALMYPYIDSSGNVGIGTTSPGSYRLYLSGGEAYCDQTTCWNDASDIALKENIRDLDYGLKEILALKPTRFLFKPTREEGIGFVAQEVEKIIPEVVSGEEGHKGISYGGLTPVLVKAIQEQQEQIEELKTQLTQLTVSQDPNTGRIVPQQTDIKIQLLSLGLVVNENGVLEVRRVRTQELCVGSVCVNEEQLKELLEKAGIALTNTGVSPP